MASRSSVAIGQVIGVLGQRSGTDRDVGCACFDGHFAKQPIQEERSMSRRSARSHATGWWVLSLVVVATMLTWTTDGAAEGKGQGKADLSVRAAEFDPEHQCDAAAAWVRNIGLTASNDAFAFALLMHKLCSTETNAAAFGLISGVKGELLIGPNALGFDYKDVNEGFVAHCGAGAPRFNVSLSDGSFHFIGGCANGGHSESPRGTGWAQVRFQPQDTAPAFPPLPTIATIVSIALVFDEGSDQDPNGSPEIVLDNIFINGKFATRP